MDRILALWATPRSTSTPFEWMMRQRNDFVTYHEPFNEVYYYGEDRKTDRDADVPAKPGLTFEAVLQALKHQAKVSRVFVKEFAYSIMHMVDDAFIASFAHTFLIRDPVKVLPSIFDKWPDFKPQEAGFEALRGLFDIVADEQGRPPPVIESDDLITQPAATVRAYCEAVGIPFMAEALSWEKGEHAEVSWYDQGSWHENLKESAGIKPQRRNYLNIDANDHLKRSYELCLPHYEALYAHKLVIPTDVRHHSA